MSRLFAAVLVVVGIIWIVVLLNRVAVCEAPYGENGPLVNCEYHWD